MDERNDPRRMAYWTKRLLTDDQQKAALANDLVLYPNRPHAVDVVALLADPHYDQHGRAEMLTGAESVANLLGAIKAMQGINTRTGIIFSHEQVADLVLAAVRVQGGAK